jgi:CDP-diacylglycerol--serine O-phosphatidyltransferase
MSVRSETEAIMVHMSFRGFRGGRRRSTSDAVRALKRIPILPSLVTLGNAFCGFLAIAKVADAVARSLVDGRLQVNEAFTATLGEAALLVFLAMVFDGLDGKVARLTKQTSDFGGQLDSLADAITFGVAPAFLAKVLIDFHAEPSAGALLPRHPRIYYLAAALYALCAIMRLARFNVETPSHEEKAHDEFVGLPSPAAAAVVASLITFWSTHNASDQVISRYFLSAQFYDGMVQAMPWVVAVCGLLMVSRFPYPHLVNWLFRGGKSFLFLWSVVVLLILAALEWPLVLMTVSVTYLALGPLLWLVRLFRPRPSDRPPEHPEFAPPPRRGNLAN